MKIKWNLLYVAIILSLILIYNFKWIKYLNYSLSPVSENYLDPKIIKDDLNFIYYGKYKVYLVDSYNMSNQDQTKKIKDQFMNIYFTDFNILLTNKFRGKEKLLTESIYIQHLLLERNLDKRIKVVNYSYQPNKGYYSIAGDYSLSINTEEFKESYEKYKAEGLSNEKILLKLSLYYSNYLK
ncbi:MAG: hypothetical protein K0S34_429 [Bacillales bacterium]|jgi:hypothetical protein|nr:hypothetical protein [Bacillales bacterium]